MTAVAQYRPLDRAESFFWFLDRLSSMNFCVIAEGRGPLSEQALKAALDRSQFRHPLLSVSIEGDKDHLLHFVPRPPVGIPLCCLDDDGWHRQLAEFNVQPFALGEYPLMRAYRFARADGGWVVALVFHHSIGDARSGFHLLGEVLRDAVVPGSACQAVSHRPALTALYPAEYSGEPAKQLGERNKANVKALIERIGPPEAHAGHLPSQEAPVPGLVPLRLGADQAQALARRSRQEQATVGGLVGAAQLIALRRLFGDAGPRTMGLTFAADLRPYLRESMDASTPGLYATLVTCLQQVSEAENLWDLARHVTTAIRQQVHGGVGHLFYHGVPPTDRMPATEEGIQDFRSLMERRPSTSLVSNAGQLPPLPDLPGLTVEALSFALCPTQVQPVFTAVTGHAGGLAINLNHNRRQLPPDAADAVATSLRDLLVAAA